MPTIALNQNTLDRTVAERHIVLVKFWAAWCQWCTRFAPIYQSSAQTHPDIVHGTVDGEAETALTAAAQIDRYPWVLGFREGLLVYSKPGFLPAGDLEELVQQIRWMDMETFHREAAQAAQAGSSVDGGAAGRRTGARPARAAGLAPGPYDYGWPGL